MSFWDTEDGNIAEAPTKSTTFDSGGFELIPDGTVVIGAVKGSEWREYEGERRISLRVDVLDGQYKNRVVFANLYVHSDKPAKKKKGLKMLLAVDANASGRLAKLQHEPTEADLASLHDAPMEWRLRIFTPKDGGDPKQYVEAVGALGALSKNKPKMETKEQTVGSPGKQPPKMDFDDDIPF